MPLDTDIMGYFPQEYSGENNVPSAVILDHIVGKTIHQTGKLITSCDELTFLSAPGDTCMNKVRGQCQKLISMAEETVRAAQNRYRIESMYFVNWFMHSTRASAIGIQTEGLREVAEEIDYRTLKDPAGDHPGAPSGIFKMGEEFVTSLREVLGEVENERVAKIQLASARLQDYIVSLEDLRPLRDPSRPPRPEPFTIEVSALEAMVSSTKKGIAKFGQIINSIKEPANSLRQAQRWLSFSDQTFRQLSDKANYLYKQLRELLRITELFKVKEENRVWRKRGRIDELEEIQASLGMQIDVCTHIIHYCVDDPPDNSPVSFTKRHIHRSSIWDAYKDGCSEETTRTAIILDRIHEIDWSVLEQAHQELLDIYRVGPQ